jgi:short-subunit dehydrogenase
LTEALRMELFGSGIRVSLVMPGVIDTPMTTDAVMEDMELGQVPAFFKMSVQWVTWAVLAAAAFGLTEVGVPPGSDITEKLTALFPGMTDAFLSVGARMLKAAGRFMATGPKST